jgi:DNA-binding MarR family transcriptional regulator
LAGTPPISRTVPVPGSDQQEPVAPPEPIRLGRALRLAWVAYQRRLDQEMAAAGFADRAFPDGRVLRICVRAGQTTIAQIGRELEITRQGAAKLVASLHDRGYLKVEASATSGREKSVSLTPRALEYLEAHRSAAREIERQVQAEIGSERLDSLSRLVQALGGEEQPRMIDYLRRRADLDVLRGPEE